MGKFLSDAQVHQYQKNGFLSNLRVLSESAAEEIRERLESLKRSRVSLCMVRNAIRPIYYFLGLTN